MVCVVFDRLLPQESQKLDKNHRGHALVLAYYEADLEGAIAWHLRVSLAYYEADLEP
jgi:hypothetical protein